MEIEAGVAVACLSGAVLSEGARPAQTWRGSVWNVLLGIAAGAYAPLGVEVYIEKLKEAHRLVVFICSFVGASVLKYLGELASERKFLEAITPARLIQLFRTTNSTGPNGEGK